jgi:hypothetical protein
MKDERVSVDLNLHFHLHLNLVISRRWRLARSALDTQGFARTSLRPRLAYDGPLALI